MITNLVLLPNKAESRAKNILSVFLLYLDDVMSAVLKINFVCAEWLEEKKGAGTLEC